jgi:hypothetical protein
VTARARSTWPGPIAGEAFPDGSDTAYLARARQFADAVAGGVLTDGPVLLSPTCGELPEATGAALAGLGPDRVAALGGPQAVCDATLQQAAEAASG